MLTSDSSNSIPTDLNFKTSLPPRKRAKTKEEKEQRRVERILRNRRAAHASREKKRKHVEYLESYVLKLEANLQSLTTNFNSVSGLLSSDQLSSIKLIDLQDVEDLKQKIHQNLNSSAASFTAGNGSSSKRKIDDDDEEELDDDLDEEESTNNTTSSATPVPTTVKSEDTTSAKITPSPQFQYKKIKLESQEPELSQGLIQPNENINNTYYNYLSPVSMNSPMNSPIDLTLSKQYQQQYQLLNLDSNVPSLTSAYEMGQNSEVILSALSNYCPSVIIV
ncbi:uncharacterized protein RJT21DRAFT_115675 [Scheffersomyces amazonensis]|uniref:uncharacterized protein n=1 Tax=Scheffersomyces amazonensis TaxID=1078765 RepID=UPI00315DEEC9